PSVSAVRTPTTGHGPAWMTVTGVKRPVSSSKTWLIPSFLPTIPFISSRGRRGPRATRASGGCTLEAEGGPRWPRGTVSGRAASQLDLDVDAGGKVEPHQRVHRLRRRRMDVDQPLVRANLEVLTGVLVDERTSDHRVDVLLGRQGHGAGHRGAGPLRGLDDRRRRAVELRVVV